MRLLNPRVLVNYAGSWKALGRFLMGAIGVDSTGLRLCLKTYPLSYACSASKLDRTHSAGARHGRPRAQGFEGRALRRGS